MSINTVSSREKEKALQSAVICIDCPQEDIFSKAIHFTMGEGSETVHLAMGRNPVTITFIMNGKMWPSTNKFTISPYIGFHIGQCVLTEDLENGRSVHDK